MRISDWSSDVCSSDLPAAVDIDAERGVLRRMQWIAVEQECCLAVVERERRREVARNEAATAARLYRGDQGDEITDLAERQQLGAQAAEGIGLAAHGIVAMDQLAILERTRRQRLQVRAGAGDGT